MGENSVTGEQNKDTMIIIFRNIFIDQVSPERKLHELKRKEQLA